MGSHRSFTGRSASAAAVSKVRSDKGPIIKAKYY